MEKTRTPLGPKNCLKPRSNIEIFAANIWATKMKVTYKAINRSGFLYFLAYQLPKRVKLVIPVIQIINNIKFIIN